MVAEYSLGQPLDTVPRGEIVKRVRLALIYVTIVVAFGLYLMMSWSNFTLFSLQMQQNPLLAYLVIPGLVWVGLVLALTAFRTIVWFRYRPEAPAAYDEAPRLTVIIPAYNEGKMVLNSIASIVENHYPSDRLEVYVIDDGSKDDTWTYIEQAVAAWPDRVTAVRFSKNQGKRAALAEGFKRARGEIVVTVDSDSMVESHALLAITGPFRDAKIGAVAGKVAVYNREAGLIPKMLETRFVLTFDVMRAVESSYGTVYCTPGAFSAYRAEAVREVLAGWQNQTFGGVRCTFGEDRALTNDLLRAGWNTHYQQSAVVQTIVPTTYDRLCKMFLRWDRSYVREEIRFMGLVGKRPPVARFLALFDRLTTNLRYPLSLLGIVAFFALAVTTPTLLLRALGAAAFVAVFNSLYYLRSNPSLAGFAHCIGFSFYATFGMWWIMPYAAFTVKAQGWLTR